MTMTSASPWLATLTTTSNNYVHAPSDARIQVRFEGEHAPPWLVQVRDRFDHLLGLEKDWDSYGAAPVENEAVKSALSILERLLRGHDEVPFIAPLADGGVQIEWTHGAIDLGFVVQAGRPPKAFVVSDDAEEEWFLDRADGLSRLLRMLGATPTTS